MSRVALPEQLVRTFRFSRGVPEGFTVGDDGRTVLFLRGRTGDDPAACLWALDVESGRERLVADPVRLLAGAGAGAGPRKAAGIDAYGADRAARVVAFALSGGLWKVDVRKGEPRRLPVVGAVTDPRPDPTGRHIAYVVQGALRVIRTDGTADRVVAQPDCPDVEFGTAVHTGATSLDGTRGYWWSPDGERVLFARTDFTGVRPWPGSDGGAGRVALVGTPNAEVTLWIAGFDGTPVSVSWDRTAYEYLVGAGWDDHGPWAVVQSRDQCTVRFLGIDPGTGRTTVLDEWRDDRWVHLVPGLPARTATGELLAHRDLLGTRHLTADGTPVTPPGLQLRTVLGTDGDDILFTASADPTETHLWCYSPKAGLRQVSSEPGVHSGVSRGGTLVHVTRDAQRPGGRTEVRRADGPTLPVLSYAESPVLGIRAERLVLGPRALHVRLHLPSWHREGDPPLPVVVDSYGGASAQRVTVELDWRVLLSQWFAEHGFAVLVTDGRGTPGRGPDWEREAYGDPFGPALDDQVAALHEAARDRPALDLGHVGIRGWSFGGTLAALAVLRRPDVFHAAVAGAGVTDQRLFNTHWRERFLGHPDVFPRRYDSCDLIAEAARLPRPLLLIHGLADPRVPAANTLRLSEALCAAERPHELLLLPGAGHQPIGSPLTVKLLHHQVRFLQRHLGAESVTSPVDASVRRP
ncbi:prolyl oligopeptidase family serine peptidase [Streptomyces sp. NPDC047072]|uniref:S9 family peptidase n=1 Tax=Streptomyces sp. NPDC047072 TaxID=3154809 RepID=UPI00340D4C35